MPNPLILHTLPVGQGDCILIEFPDASWAIIDCGARTGSYVPASIASTYIDKLAHREAHIRFILVTHPDSDHDGGINDLLCRPPRPVNALYYSCKRLIDSKESFGMITYIAEANQLLKEGSLAEVKILRANDEIATGIADLTIRVLSPDAEHSQKYTENLRSSRNRNAMSIVLELIYGKNRIILFGDVTDEALRQIFSTDTLHCPNVLKVPHHGSIDGLGPFLLRTSSDRESVAIISCASQVKSKPHKEILKKLWETSNLRVRCTGLSSHCDPNNAVYLPSVPPSNLPSTIERALRASFREAYSGKWELCCPELVISVPPYGHIDYRPSSKSCDNIKTADSEAQVFC